MVNSVKSRIFVLRENHDMKAEKRMMNIVTYHRCFEICEEVRKTRAGKEIRLRDYPAAIVTCAESWKNYMNCAMESSGKANDLSYRKTPVLEAALRTLGDIGKQRVCCKNYIGACAEPHAARTVMTESNVKDVKDLAFSYAYRPRTKSVIRYCRNCTDIFDVVNP